MPTSNRIPADAPGIDEMLLAGIAGCLISLGVRPTKATILAKNHFAAGKAAFLECPEPEKAHLALRQWSKTLL